MRPTITMTPAEVSSLLVESRLVTCATIGPRGLPHLMPMLYMLRPTGPDGTDELWTTTFAKSQKVRNLERDSRATLLIDTGDAYFDFCGLMLECDVVIHRDVDDVSAALAE